MWQSVLFSWLFTPPSCKRITSMPSTVCLALANGVWIDTMETTLEWKFLEPSHGSPMALFPLCLSNCMSLSNGLLQFRPLQEEAMRITHRQRTADKQHEWGGKKIFSVESQRNLGLGCQCNIVWQKLTNRACEPIWANEREQIPGPVGLLINKSLLYSVLGVMCSWKAEHTGKPGSLGQGTVLNQDLFEINSTAYWWWPIKTISF